MSKPLSYTTAAIGNALKRGGLERSTSTTTRIKGYRSVTSGYSVKKSNFGGSVLVEWVSRLGTTAETREQMFVRLGEVLTNAGYRIERTDWHGEANPQGHYWSIKPVEPTPHQFQNPVGTVC